MKYEEIFPLIKWRDRATGGSLSDAELVESLSVESLPYSEVPAEFASALSAFRTNQDRRLRLIRRYRADHGTPVNCTREGCLHEPADSACIPDPEVT